MHKSQLTMSNIKQRNISYYFMLGGVVNCKLSLFIIILLNVMILFVVKNMNLNFPEFLVL